MTKKLLLAFAMIAFAVPAFAAKPILYTVKKGDTLWGISERFIKDPMYWPDLWGKNSGLSNPHLIFPGQKLNVYGDRIEFEKENIPVITKKVEATQEPKEAWVFKATSPLTFVSITTPGEWGMIIDSVDSKEFLAIDDEILIDLPDSGTFSVGSHLSVAEIGEDVKHPITGVEIGVMVNVTGEIEVTSLLDDGTAMAKIVYANQEVERENRLFAMVPSDKEIEIKKPSSDIYGFVSASADGRTMLGYGDVVLLDVGTDNGVEEGNMFYVSRLRNRSKLSNSAPDMKIPEALIGAAIVVDAKEFTSSAILFKVGEDVQIGDRVISIMDDPLLR